MLVAPTSTSAAPASFRPSLTIGEAPTRVLVEQMRALDVERLGAFVGRADARELREIDDGLELVLGLR